MRSSRLAAPHVRSELDMTSWLEYEMMPYACSLSLTPSLSLSLPQALPRIPSVRLVRIGPSHARPSGVRKINQNSPQIRITRTGWLGERVRIISHAPGECTTHCQGKDTAVNFKLPGGSQTFTQFCTAIRAQFVTRSMSLGFRSPCTANARGYAGRLHGLRGFVYFLLQLLLLMYVKGPGKVSN